MNLSLDLMFVLITSLLEVKNLLIVLGANKFVVVLVGIVGVVNMISVLNVLKNSSFGAVIAYPEIVSVFMGSALNATGQAIEIIAITLAIYLAAGLTVSGVMNWVNARTALVTR